MSDSEAEASYISDEEVFRRKLMLDGEGTGASQKIDDLYCSFLQWCEATNQTEEEITEGYEKLLAQLDNLEFSSRKSAEAQRANVRQMEEYDKTYTDLETQVCEVKKVIEERQLELEKAKKERMNKMKYDALGRIISSLPDRKESKKQLEKVEEDIKALKLEKQSLQKKSKEWEKHLGLLLTAAHELKNKLRKELEDSDGSESD